MGCKKSEALGMAWGTANGKLRKMILFSLVCRLSLNLCYRCDSEILSIDDLSIEHKEPWSQADDPVQSFFDLNNIAFSHLSCNVNAGSEARKKWPNAQARKNASHRRWWADKTPIQRRENRKKRYEKYGN